MSGAIGTKDEFILTVRAFFQDLGVELSAEDLSTYAPERSVISGEHRGPMQFAKFVVGSLRGKHWKTVHNWINEEASLEPAVAFGLSPSTSEVIEYVHRHAGHGSYAVFGRHLQRLVSLRALLKWSPKSPTTKRDA